MSVAETTAETPAAEGAAVPDEWAAALAEQADAGAVTADAGTAKADAATTAAPAEQKMNYARAEFQELKEEEHPQANNEANLDVILDVTVTLSMEIGRTKISIRNLLKLNQGSVVELDRLAGEPMDVLVNNCLIAHGEVVVVNDKFGIRLTDVISAAERVKKLK